MADRHCGNCGHELRPDDRFCPNCGRSVLQTAVVPTPEAATSVPPLPTPPPAPQEQQTQGSGGRGSDAGGVAGCAGIAGLVMILLIIALVIALLSGRGEAAAWLFVVLLILSPVGAFLAFIARGAGRGRTVPVRSHGPRAMPYKEYLQTPYWKRRREDKLRAAGYRCQFCNRGSVTLDVHHRTYERLGEELDGDLTVLCRDCHHTLHEHRRLGR